MLREYAPWNRQSAPQYECPTHDLRLGVSMGRCSSPNMVNSAIPGIIGVSKRREPSVPVTESGRTRARQGILIMSAVEDIKQRLDIVDIIGTYVPLKKAGANFKGICPFHTEKTPSFIVFPESQRWHCFGACSTGGDLFSFVMRQENMEFGEALRLLASRAGIELEPVSESARQQRDALDRMREINALAASFFQHTMLATAEGAPGRDYFARRSVSEQSVSAFQLGYAPNDWHHLEQYLKSKGVSQQEALGVGLLSSNEAGNVYDRFRGRVMFPIRDAQGRIIGFGGRVLDDSQPKYLNTPQTPLFDKGSVLYGIDLARGSIRESGTTIIVEGYMDVIIPHQCGVTNIVACMGTALSEAHIEALRRSTRTLILALDPDEAGIRAAEKGAQTAREALPHQMVPVPDARGLIRYEDRLDAEIRILMLPDGLDPDELILSDRERWDRLVEGALPVADFYFQLAMREIDVATAKGKKRAAERLLPIIASMDNPVERTHYLQRLAQWIRVDERELLPQLDRLRRPARRAPRRESPEPPPPASAPPRHTVPVQGQARVGLSLEERCLMLMLENPALAAEAIAAAELSVDSFDDTRHREIFARLVPLLNRAEEDFTIGVLTERLDTETNHQVESLLQQYRSGPPLSGEMLREDILKCATRLRRQQILRRIEELRFVQQDSQEQGLKERVRELNAQIKLLTTEYLQIERRFYAATFVGRRNTELL